MFHKGMGNYGVAAQLVASPVVLNTREIVAYVGHSSSEYLDILFTSTEFSEKLIFCYLQLQVSLT
jgi:hypothetical protein